MPIDELHLSFNREQENLANRIKEDIRTVSPGTTVILDIIQLKAPWDFEEVYEKFFDYAKSPCFHEEHTRCYIHMTTSSHVEQICLFLLAESRHLAAQLIQPPPRMLRLPRKGFQRGAYGH
ncbi:MAG: RNA repair transcriptional activator RtcR family protein [Kiritimatiellia bacterium]